MALKQEILGKIPKVMHLEPHVQALLDNVKRHNLGDKGEIMRFLVSEISSVEQWLQQNRQTHPASVRLVKEKAIQLEMLRKCKELSQQFL